MFSRINESASLFSKLLLQEILIKKAFKPSKSRLFEKFGKVLLQDSTTIHLPSALKDVFVGSTSQFGANSLAKIQSIIDIKSMRFIQFGLTSYTKNDQSASASILENCKKGDIVIRDLGYYSTKVFEQIMQIGADFLSRQKYAVKIFDENGKEILLKTLFNGNRVIDKWVYIGIKNRVRVRLIMVPLPKEQAVEKIRKAKWNKDKRNNHDSNYYKWISYSIYITTVEEDIWTTKDVCEAYKVRWQIEIIFKSWKSGFKLEANIHSGFTNKDRVLVYIYLMLVFICLFTVNVYCKYKDKIESKLNIQISILKLTAYYCTRFFEIFNMTERQIEKIIIKYCCYEKRKDRTNLTELYQNKNP